MHESAVESTNREDSDDYSLEVPEKPGAVFPLCPLVEANRNLVFDSPQDCIRATMPVTLPLRASPLQRIHSGADRKTFAEIQARANRLRDIPYLKNDH